MSGASGEGRTPDFLLRRQMLYPAELQTHLKCLSFVSSTAVVRARRECTAESGSALAVTASSFSSAMKWKYAFLQSSIPFSRSREPFALLETLYQRPSPVSSFLGENLQDFFGLNDLLSLLTESTLAGNDPAVKRFLKNLLAEAAGVEPASKVLETPILPLN